MLIKFGSWDDEAKDINSGKLKSITREIDRYDPVFERIQYISEQMALVKIGDPMAFKNHSIDIRGEGEGIFRIKKISYLDGNVIIEW